jgi:preprotein translocase subunit SecY
MTIFALNIMPTSRLHHHAALTAVSPQLEGEEGGRGRPQEAQPVTSLRHGVITRCRYGIASGWRAWVEAGSAVIDPGMFFRFTTVVTLDRRHMFLMWLGEQITHAGSATASR